MNHNIIGFAAMIAMAVVFMVVMHYKAKAAATKAAKDLIDTKARNDALWAVDYHNPASSAYDPARVAAETAAAQAAWADDPTNPASPNYDPNA